MLNLIGMYSQDQGANVYLSRVWKFFQFIEKFQPKNFQIQGDETPLILPSLCTLARVCLSPSDEMCHHYQSMTFFI